MNPTVSVVIPCFNHGQYVDEAVQSVLAQTWPHVEIIVVDDGSDDPGTIERLRDYREPYTRVLKRPHGGLALARNTGIAAASGQYLCALDADDRLAPEFLHKAVSRLEADPALTFVSCWLETFEQEHWVWKPVACDLPTLLSECTVCTAAVVRLPAARAIGGFDEGMPEQGYEDWDFWISLVERGYVGTILPEILFHYRRTPASMSSKLASAGVHSGLMHYLIQKHAPSYERHMAEVLQKQDEDIGQLLRDTQQLERHLTTWLEPELTRRLEELEFLEAKLRTASAPDANDERESRLAARVSDLEQSLTQERLRISQLSAALQHRGSEIDAFRNSKSWKVTRPLRALYGYYMGLTRRRAGPAA